MVLFVVYKEQCCYLSNEHSFCLKTLLEHVAADFSKA
jgi:hypothetical protein